MRLRLAAVGICSLAMVAGVGSPAQVKGEGFFVLRGPHLSRPIVLKDPVEVAALFWGAGTGEQTRMDPPDRADGLGPRYALRYVYWDVNQPNRKIRQFIHPLAEAGKHGMWVFTPHGQHWYGGTNVVPGWWLLSVDAERTLEAHGLTDALFSVSPSSGHFRPV